MEYIDAKKGYTKEDIEKLARIIQIGGVVILPTDTVYGLVSNALDEEAIKKIYELKQRIPSKPVNILVSNAQMIKKVTKKITRLEEKIIKNFFPGALTIIFEKNEKIPNIVTAGLDTIGIRMPNCKLLLDLMDFLRDTNCSN